MTALLSHFASSRPEPAVHPAATMRLQADIEMTFKAFDLIAFQQRLDGWRGADASINSFRDDQDRLIVRLTDPTCLREPVGLAFFNCTYLAGPVSWTAMNLVVQESQRDDGSPGYEVRDEGAGFVVRFASSSLYGDEESFLRERS
ncbi:hypothetical protein [Variovorax gossypii]